MSVSLTEGAAKEILRVVADQGLSEKVLRVGVSGGGCSGFNYNMNFVPAEEVDPLNDDQFENFGVKFVVDRKSAMYLEGTVVDWTEDLNRRGFSFANPQSKRGCGCGQSFST